MTSKRKAGKQKSIEEYRRDIFSLKSKIKSEQQYLQELKQKHSDLDIFGEESYTYGMKIKILEYNLTDVKAKIDKYSADPAALYYQINFCAYALNKACEIVGITPQMVFRGVDMDCKNVVNWFNFSNMLKQTLRLQSAFVNPIMKTLDPKDSTEITKQRYTQFLQSFMISTQKNLKQNIGINDGVIRVCKQIIKFDIKVLTIWKADVLNIATCCYGLKSALKDLDILDCVAVYCKCDPNKQGVTQTKIILNMLEHKIKDVRTYYQGENFKISKNK